MFSRVTYVPNIGSEADLRDRLECHVLARQRLGHRVNLSQTLFGPVLAFSMRAEARAVEDGGASDTSAGEWPDGSLCETFPGEASMLKKPPEAELSEVLVSLPRPNAPVAYARRVLYVPRLGQAELLASIVCSYANAINEGLRRMTVSVQVAGPAPSSVATVVPATHLHTLAEPLQDGVVGAELDRQLVTVLEHRPTIEIVKILIPYADPSGASGDIEES